MYIILFIVIIIIYFFFIPSEIFDNILNVCIKEFDNTEIKVINDKWKSDFEGRFKNHEPNSNLKLKELLRELPNNSYIIDVGSHVGDTGLYLAYILKHNYQHKNVKVIMIDPDDSKINFINKMSKANNLDNILTMNYGVSDKPNKGSLDKRFHPGGWKIETKDDGNINLDTLDNLCKNKLISLMHIDVEGMEYQCLLGSTNILKNVKYIMIELNGLSNRSKEYNFLKNNNFVEIPDEKIKSENGNVLFIKK